jgi:hypothetical protein
LGYYYSSSSLSPKRHTIIDHYNDTKEGDLYEDKKNPYRLSLSILDDGDEKSRVVQHWEKYDLNLDRVTPPPFFFSLGIWLSTSPGPLNSYFAVPASVSVGEAVANYFTIRNMASESQNPDYLPSLSLLS